MKISDGGQGDGYGIFEINFENKNVTQKELISLFTLIIENTPENMPITIIKKCFEKAVKEMS